MSSRRTGSGPGIALGAGLMLWSSSAAAHLVTTGLGPVYDGITHFFLSLEDLLPVIALALLAGLNGPRSGRYALFSLPLAWLLGGLAGYASGQAPLPGLITAVSAVLLGGLVAADRRLRPALVATLAGAMGLLHGWLNGAGIAEANREGLALAGIGAAAFVGIALVSGLVVSLRRQWMRVATRVAGSWIAAIGLLLLGWALRAG